MDFDTLSPEIKDRLAQLERADVLVAMPGVATGDGLRAAAMKVRAGLAGLAQGTRVVLVHPDGAMADDAASSEGPALLPFPIAPFDRLPGPGPDTTPGPFGAIFAASSQLGVRGCAVVGSDPAALAPEALLRLVQPVLEKNFDLVTPCYLRRRFEGLLASAVISPVVRALYGRRIRFPLGADYGLSARMVERCLLPVPGREALPVWLASNAVCAGFQIGQAQLAVPMPALKEPPDVSTAVSQVLGPLFADIERNAACWQKVRASQPVATFGPAPGWPDEPGAVDVSRMVETFRLGYRNLGDVWRSVLPPVSLLELKRLTHLAPEEFRLPDDVWARIIYDFALAWRLRIMSRDHLLGALTPLYLGWVASFAVEVGASTPATVEQRLDTLGAAFEAQKPYFVSRWRWPDRF